MRTLTENILFTGKICYFRSYFRRRLSSQALIDSILYSDSFKYALRILNWNRFNLIYCKLNRLHQYFPVYILWASWNCSMRTKCGCSSGHFFHLEMAFLCLFWWKCWNLLKKSFGGCWSDSGDWKCNMRWKINEGNESWSCRIHWHLCNL